MLMAKKHYKAHYKTRYFLIAFFVQLLWAFTPTASGLVIREIPIELFAALRWTISGCVFLLIALIKGYSFDFNPKMLFYYFILGVLGYGLTSLGVLYSLKIGGVVNFSLLSSLKPMISALVAIAILREVVDKSYWKALLFCVGGLLVIVVGKFQLSGISSAFLSTFLIIASNFCEPLPFVFSKKFQFRQSLFGYLAILQLSAAFFLWIIQLFYFKQTASLSQATTIALSSLIFVSIVSCVICYAIWYWLLRHVDGHRLAIFDGIHALFSSILGALFFGEIANTSMVLGGLMLVAALYWAHFAPHSNITKKT